MGRRRDGGCQEVGGEKLEECCKEQGQLAEASKEGLGSNRAVVPMMMMMLLPPCRADPYVGFTTAQSKNPTTVTMNEYVNYKSQATLNL